MQIPIYQVDAFTSELFHGNPAAVCPLENWLDDATMQAIAAENNLAETAFYVPQGERYGLRWFTPAVEVDLCGHATLATAFVLFSELNETRDVLTFATRSGDLAVRRDGDVLTMDFPALPCEPCEAAEDLLTGLGTPPVAVFGAMDYMVVYEHEADVRALQPDMRHLSRLDRRGVIVTAPGTSSDFVSRFFAPAAGIPEDPVTGSAHCMLTPYWAQRLGKQRLHARQISARGGDLLCETRGDRVMLSGGAVLYLRGTIHV